MIIITGASRGIGKFLLEQFIIDGFEVVGTYNNSIIELHNSYYKVDVMNFQETEEWIHKVTSSSSELILINCAGISYNAFAHKSDIDQWGHVIDVNIKGTFNVIRCVLPLMRQQKYGRIINFSSVVTKYPTPGISAYITSKAAINGLTKSLARENGALGITVNSINLGYVNVGMGVEQVPEEYQKQLKHLIPAGRFCEPMEIFNTVKYIIKNEYLNGSILDLNGALI
jgi:NAD(P)-dependent dehydrogenase (short-subunit alcohol dehydrogenase family)